jgi:hypothetical protein
MWWVVATRGRKEVKKNDAGRSQKKERKRL